MDFELRSLPQVVRLTEEPFAAAKGVKSPLTEKKIVEWLVENKVLSIALQGEGEGGRRREEEGEGEGEGEGGRRRGGEGEGGRRRERGRGRVGVEGKGSRKRGENESREETGEDRNADTNTQFSI